MEATETELQLAEKQREIAAMLEQLREELPEHTEAVRAEHAEFKRISGEIAQCKRQLAAADFPAPPVPPVGSMQSHFAKVQQPRGPHFPFDPLAQVAVVDTSPDMEREKARARS